MTKAFRKSGLLNDEDGIVETAFALLEADCYTTRDIDVNEAEEYGEAMALSGTCARAEPAAIAALLISNIVDEDAPGKIARKFSPRVEELVRAFRDVTDFSDDPAKDAACIARADTQVRLMALAQDTLWLEGTLEEYEGIPLSRPIEMPQVTKPLREILSARLSDTDRLAASLALNPTGEEELEKRFRNARGEMARRLDAVPGLSSAAFGVMARKPGTRPVFH